MRSSGLIGARLYFLLVHAPHLLQTALAARIVGYSRDGGWSVFGALITFVPASFAAAAWLEFRQPSCWDHMAVGVLAGGFWIRLGCVFNGCCAGRETHGAAGRASARHAWRDQAAHPGAVSGNGVVAARPRRLSHALAAALPHGSYALAVMAWYGTGRFFLEPLREQPDVVFGRVRIDQVVAAAAGARGRRRR